MQKTAVTIDDIAFDQSDKQKLTKLRTQGRFLLDGCKLDVMVDSITTSPLIKNDAYIKTNNKIAFVRSGMLSCESEPVPICIRLQKSSITWDPNLPLI
jgi:hypothetical protein